MRSSPCRRLSLLGFAYPFVGPHLRCRIVTGGQRSLDAGIEKKSRIVDLIYFFVNIYGL